MPIKIKETKDLESFKLSKEIKEEKFLMHTQEWQTFIESSFNKNKSSNILNQKFIVAINKDLNEIETLLPITKIKSSIFKNRIVSCAYQEYGGFIGKQEHQKTILNYIKNQYQNEFDFLEIRGAINKINNSTNSNLLKKTIHQNRFIINLKKQTLDQIKQNIQKSKRKAIKKAQKNLSCKELDLNNKQTLKEFYKLYLQNMRSFGSPPYSKFYFKTWAKQIQLQNIGQIFGCYQKDTLVSALLGFTFNKKVHITIAISDPKFSQHRPSDLMHWEFIKWAKENGFDHFDFGLARNESGQFEYKRKWGTTQLPLPTYYLSLKSNKIPEPLNPNNKKFQVAIKTWRYIPLKITQLVGMWLRKQLGI